MSASSRSRIVFPLVSAIALFAFQANAQEQRAGPPPQGAQAHPGPGRPGAVQGRPGPVHPGGPGGFARGPDARFAHGAIVAHNFGGHPYRGRLAWEGGRWRHEIHDGRDGWWWDVGGVWYFYPQPMDGPPTYVSDDYADDVVYADAPAAAYAPPPGAYAPGPGAYAPPPPPAPPPPAPPPPDPGASAVGGAVVGGLLGGLLTGRASGAAAGAVIGGLTGAVAASHPGYYLANGSCYYRYPSGQYVAADPRWCY